MGKALYFQATDGSTGADLWKVNAAGSAGRAADIKSGAGSSGPGDLTVFNGELYFHADDGTHGVEPWKVKADGSIVPVADIRPGSGDSLPFGTNYLFTPFNNE